MRDDGRGRHKGGWVSVLVARANPTSGGRGSRQSTQNDAATLFMCVWFSGARTPLTSVPKGMCGLGQVEANSRRRRGAARRSGSMAW